MRFGTGLRFTRMCTVNKSSSFAAPALPEDTTPPVVSSVGYVSGNVFAALSETATVYFLFKTTAATIGQAAFNTAMGNALVSGSFAGSAGPNSVAVPVTDLTPGTWYLHVLAQDAAGNRSAVSVVSDPYVVDAADTTAPAITGLSYSAGNIAATLSENATVFYLFSTSTAPIAQASFASAAGSALVSGSFAGSSGANSVAKAVTALTPGTWYLHAIGEDAAGNRTASSVVSAAYTVATPDTTAPTITNLAYAAGSATFTISEGATASYLFSASATPIAQSAFANAMSSALVSGNFAATSGSNSRAISAAALTPGTWYLHVIGQDAAGNRTASSAVSSAYTVATPDTTAPAITGLACANGNATFTISEPATVSLLFSTSATPIAQSAFAAAMSSALVTNTYSPTTSGAKTRAIDSSALTAGTWYLHALGQDAAGNKPATSVVSSGYVVAAADSTAPAVTSLAFAGGNATADMSEAGTVYYLFRTSATPIAQASFASAMSSALVSGSSAVAAGSNVISVNPAALTPGTWYFHVIGEDAAGNRTATSSVSAAYVVAPATSTRSTITAINADGWSVQDSAPITYDPVGNPQYVVARRPGFDTAGAAVTVVDNVIVTKRKRQPYPSQTSLTANSAALSDYIYASDVVTGFTNNSTRAAPKPQAMWLTPDLERARTGTFKVRLAVAHGHARNGTPVAAVKFIASDGTNSVSVTVNTMSSRQWASGLFGAYYEATLNISTLNPATICTVDAIIYPWVGAAYQASVDGVAYPSANFTVLKFLNDRTGSFGEAYAYVSTTGNDGTGVTSATATTAAANPYQTIAAAAAGIKAFNTTTYSRALADGGTIRLLAGTHTISNFSSATVTDFPLVIEASNVANKATTIIQDPAEHCFGYWPKKMKIKDLTLKKIGDSVFFLDTGASDVAGGNMVTLENVKINQNGTSDYTGWFGDIGRFYVYECDCATKFSAFRRFSGADPKATIVIGSDIKSGEGANGNVFYGAFASKVAGVGIARGNSSMDDSAGTLVAYCFISGPDTLIVPDSSEIIGPRGWALVMSVVEATTTTEVSPCIELWDSGTGGVQNLVLMGNTIVGARSNIFYNDEAGVRPKRDGYIRLNVIENLNMKSDVFATDGLNVNNWASIYKTSMLANCLLRGSYDSAADPGVGIWMGELSGLGEVNGSRDVPLVSGFVTDASGKGTGAGNGNYTPGNTSVIPAIPSGWAAYPIDQKGRAISNTGTAKVGAIQA